MADLQKIIEIVFEGTDNASGAISSLGKSLETFSGNLESATQPLADITGTLLKFEAGVVAVGASLAGVAINQAGKFSDATNEIYTLIDASPQQFGKFRDEILSYSQDSTQSIESINSAIYSAISAGIEYGEAIEFIAATEQAAVAGKADLNDATVLLASTLNAYGADVDEVTRYSDALFTTVKEGQVNFTELANSLSQVTPTASALGVDIETLGAAIATITAKGTPAAQAMTELRQILVALIAPSEQAKNLSEELGLAFSAEQVKAKGLDAVLREVIQSTGGNEESLKKLFGSVEAVNGVIQLSQNNFALFDDKLTAFSNTSGATSEAYAKMGDNFGLVNQQIANNIDAVLIKAGDKLLDQFGGTAESLIDVFKSLGQSIDSGAFDPLFEAINALGLSLEETLNDIAKNLPEALAGVDWTPIINGLGEIGKGAAAIFDGVDLSTPEGLKNAIQGIVDVGGRLLGLTGDLVGDIGPLINKLGEWATKAGDADSGTGDFVQQLLRFGTEANIAAGYLGAFGGVLQSAGNTIASLAGAAYLTKLAGGAKLFGGALALLTNPLTIAAGGAAALGAGAAKLVQELDPLEPIVRASAEASEQFALNQEKLGQSLDRVSEQTGIGIYSYEQFQEAVKSGAIALNEETGKWEAASDAIDEHSQFLLDSNEIYQAAVKIGQDLVGTQEEQAETTQRAGKYIVSTVDGVKTYTQNLAYATDNTKDFNETGKELTLTEQAKAKALKEDVKALLDYEAKMEEIASNERIKTLELAVEFNIEQMKADAEKVVQAFKTVGETYEATTQLISDLVGEYAGLDKNQRLKQIEIERLIEKQLKLQEEQWEKEKELLDAEIANIKEKTRRLNSGEPIITIDTNGLEPILDELLYTILEKIQIRANDEGQAFLLGCAA